MLRPCGTFFCHQKYNYLRLLGIAILMTCMTFAICAETAAVRIHYPNSQSENDTRVAFPLRLLTLVFSKIPQSLELVPSNIVITQSRALKLLDEEHSVDIVWAMTTLQREKDYLPIRIPIFKGLIGWRLLIIKEQNQLLFEHIDNLSQLKKLVAGQGLDWPDTDILRSNGLTVMNSTSYEGLFDMLNKDRFDYFPRSITEAWQEVAIRSELGLSVEKNLLLYYPTAMYYFLNKEDVDLALNIQKGLELAIEDGSFDELFNNFTQEFLGKSNLANRVVIPLSAPKLFSDKLLSNDKLWFRLPKPVQGL